MDEAQLTEFFGGKSLDDRFRTGLNLIFWGHRLGEMRCRAFWHPPNECQWGTAKHEQAAIRLCGGDSALRCLPTALQHITRGSESRSFLDFLLAAGSYAAASRRCLLSGCPVEQHIAQFSEAMSESHMRHLS